MRFPFTKHSILNSVQIQAKMLALALFALIPLCYGQQVENIVLTGEDYQLSTPGYPQRAPANSELIWNFSTSDPSVQISLNCFDLSTTRADEWYPCGSSSMVVLDDGHGEQTLCGTYHGFYKLSKGSTLTVTFRNRENASGRFTCKARANVKKVVETKHITVGDKHSLISGRADKHSDLTWHIVSDPDTKIKLSCATINTEQSTPCSADKVIIEDANNAREYCGSKSAYIETDSEWLTIKLLTGEYPGYFDCSVRRMKPVKDEHIKLELGQPAYTKIIRNDDRYLNKTWTFTTNPGAKVAISCPDIRFPGYRTCKDDIYVVDDGTGEKIYCSSNSGIAFFSNDQTIKFRIQSGDMGVSGIIHCVAQAVDGPNPDHYLNIASAEVDSSEHGKEDGVKKTNCRCGWTNKGANRAARVLHGTDALPNEYPWMVAIRDSSGFYFCGGSIITHWHVLTATHCLVNKENDDLYAVVAEHNIGQDDQDKIAKPIKIAKRFYASGYSPSDAFANDIAVVLLSEKLEFNNIIGPVCLTPNRLKLDNQYIKLMGWGTTHDSYNSKILQKANVRVVDINICDVKYRNSLIDKGEYHKVCTHSNTTDFCSGDSGGPLVWLDPDTNRYTQVSLVSFSHGCGHHTPSISTEISYYYNWIQQIIRQTYPDEVTCQKI